MRYEVIKDFPIKPQTGAVSDQLICLTSAKAIKAGLSAIRRVEYLDVDTDKRYVFITNQMHWSARTVADIYKSRWEVGVPGQGHIIQSVKVRPRLRDSSLVAWEALWRESKTVEPSDHVLALECSNVPGCNVQ